jgi:hypothetical protein
MSQRPVTGKTAAIRQMVTDYRFREALAEHRGSPQASHSSSFDLTRFCSETCKAFWGVKKGWHACPHSAAGSEVQSKFGWR